MSRATTAVVHNEGTVYIIILDEVLLLGESMDHSLINPNHIRSFSIPVYDNLFDRTQEFLIDHKKLFIPFNMEGTTVLFDIYVPSYHN